jgi:hypothetical protein
MEHDKKNNSNNLIIFKEKGLVRAGLYSGLFWVISFPILLLLLQAGLNISILFSLIISVLIVLFYFKFKSKTIILNDSTLTEKDRLTTKTINLNQIISMKIFPARSFNRFSLSSPKYEYEINTNNTKLNIPVIENDEEFMSKILKEANLKLEDTNWLNIKTYTRVK